MSSLEVTPDLIEKRGTFSIRTSSFQKLKCSATYQFHLAGSKAIWTKESLTHLFEKVITHSRTILHVAFVVLALPTYSLFTMVLAKVFGLNLVIENESTAKLQSSENFFVRIRRIHNKNNNNNNKNIKTETAVTSNTVEDRLKPEIPESIKCNPLKAITNFRLNNKIKRHGYLSICVYCCILAAYIQFVILIAALNISSTPPGLIFLSFSSFIIGYIVYKILFKPKSTNIDLKSPSRPTSSAHFRISRATNRRYLEFNDKTLSKVKLL